MKSVFAAIVAIAASVVYAESVVSSQPSQNQVLTAGASTRIVWKPINGTIASIDLRKGDATALTYIQNIAANVDASLGSYAWNVDATLASGTDYALSFGQSPDVSYTPFFTIQAANGVAETSSAVESKTGGKSSSSATTAATTVAPAAPAVTSSSASEGHKGNKGTSASASAPAATTSATSGSNKNVAAVGVAAVAGAVVAALI